MTLVKKIGLFAPTSAFLLLAISLHVHAAVYIDSSQTDEITISNLTELTGQTEIEVIHDSTLKDNSNLLIFNNKKNLPYHNEVLLAAKKTDLAPALIHAVISAESKHNPHAVSHKGAVGLMQLMPETAARFNVLDRKNPQQNILAGSKYLRELLKTFNGDLKLSLAAYNAGPNAVIKYHNQVPPYQETQRYVPKVLKYYKEYI